MVKYTRIFSCTLAGAMAMPALLWGSILSAQPPVRTDTAMDRAHCLPDAEPDARAVRMMNSLREPGLKFEPIDLAAIPVTMDRKNGDYPGLCRYARQNAAARQPVNAVFMGDSITDAWIASDPAMFSDRTLDRGISGQTTGQMLGRFMADVIALKPRVVHIMAGTNDIAGNMGPTTEATFRGNMVAMVTLARANGIRVVLASLLPADHFWWAPEWKPAARIAALNAWLKAYARANAIPFVDYYAAMAEKSGALPARYANDGVHPNRDGYRIMRPMAEAAIAAALRKGARQGNGTALPAER